MLIRHINSIKEYRCVIVSLMKSSRFMTDKLRDNVDVINLNCDSSIDLLLSPFKLKKIINHYQPNAVYSWMYHANFVAALTKLLMLNTILIIWNVRHSLDDLCGESVSTKLAIYVGRLFNFVPNNVIYCSSRAMKQHIDFGYSKQNKSVYIPNGYDFLELPQRPFENKMLVLGAAGRFHEAKDYKTLFKAVAPILSKYVNICLKIAGRNVDNDNLTIKKYMDVFSINPSQVELLGQISDMPLFYSSIDFFILSSKTEGFPNVLAEAAGAGCITFSTDVGDAGLIINDEERLVNIGDAIAITRLLDCYINKSPEELRAISNQSANYIRANYSIASISKKIFSLGSAL